MKTITGQTDWDDYAACACGSDPGEPCRIGPVNPDPDAPERPQRLFPHTGRPLTEFASETTQELIIADQDERDRGVCNCESYDPCRGECCGPGNCTCSMTPGPGQPDDDARPEPTAEKCEHRPDGSLLCLPWLKCADCPFEVGQDPEPGSRWEDTPDGTERPCFDTGTHPLHPYASGMNGMVKHFTCPGIPSPGDELDRGDQATPLEREQAAEDDGWRQWWAGAGTWTEDQGQQTPEPGSHTAGLVGPFHRYAECTDDHCPIHPD